MWYAEEKKSLWEDFRHGMIIGTKEFVDKIRSKYIPDNFHKEIPQHRALGKSLDPEKAKAMAKIVGQGIPHHERLETPQKKRVTN